MKNPISINFCFENCEYCEIPIEFIHSFSVGDVTTSRNFYPHNQGMKDYVIAGTLRVRFKESAKEFIGETQIDASLAMTRLTKYNDICWFGIKYDDRSEDNYQVKWVGDDQYNNEGQCIEDHGQELIISINEKNS